MDSLFILVLVFFAVVALTMSAFWYVSRLGVRSRMQEMTRRMDSSPLDMAQDQPEPAPRRDRMLEMFEASNPDREPDDDWRHSPIRTRLMHAGFYGASLQGVFVAIKAVLSVLLCVGSFVLLDQLSPDAASASVVLFALIGAAIGYLLPDYVLSRLVEQRKSRIRKGLPEAADFLVVCVEAGQALDSAFVRVAREMQLSCPDLAREMHWVTLEFRAGRPRTQALENMAERTGVDDVETLTSMINQADRFGTSTSDALRVYADMLRVKRRQQAEETAAKIPVKLLFPLIFFIFPALLVVLAGPAMVQIARVLLPAMGSSN